MARMRKAKHGAGLPHDELLDAMGNRFDSDPQHIDLTCQTAATRCLASCSHRVENSCGKYSAGSATCRGKSPNGQVARCPQPFSVG